MAREAAARLAAAGLSDHYNEIFRITRLTDFIDTFENAEAALERL